MMDDMTAATKGAKTRSRILAKAMELFNTKGYHATRISDIVEASGVQKGNLYFHFKSKEALALALLEEARRGYMVYLKAHLKGRSAMEKLNNVLDAVIEYHSRKDFVGGCIFGNIALEMGDQNIAFQKLVRAVFDEWADLFASLLREALSQGEAAMTLDPDRMARHIVASLEGGIMLSRLTKDRADVLNAAEFIRSVLVHG